MRSDESGRVVLHAEDSQPDIVVTARPRSPADDDSSPRLRPLGERSAAFAPPHGPPKLPPRHPHTPQRPHIPSIPGAAAPPRRAQTAGSTPHIRVTPAADATAPPANTVPATAARYGERVALPTPPPTDSLPPVTRRLRELAAQRATGALVLVGTSDEAAIFFKDGGVIRVVERPERKSERLGQLLVRAGDVTTEQLHHALEYATNNDCRIGDAVVLTARLSPNRIIHHLVERLGRRLAEHAWSKPRKVHFQAGVDVGRNALPLGVPVLATLFRHNLVLLNGRDAAERARSDASLAGQWLGLDEDPESLARELRLEGEVRKLWRLLATRRYLLEELYQISPMSPARTHSAVFAWLALGLLGRHRDPAEDTPIALVETKGSEAEDRYAAVRQRLEAKTKQLDEHHNLFDVLDLHWTATTPEVEGAYAEHQRLYRCDPDAPAELRRQSEDILERVAQAHQTLRNAGPRRTYRRRRAEPGQIEFSAKHLLDQGNMALFKGDLRAALDDFTRVLELVPEQAQAKAKLEDILDRLAIR